MRRTLVVICVAVVAAAAAVAILASSASSRTQLQANQQAAHADARRLLALLRLPRGVTAVSARPTFVPNSPSATNSRYSAGDQKWWITELDPNVILAYVRAHKPRGATIFSGGGGPTSVDLMMSWPALGREAWNRSLTLSVIYSPGTRSAVLAQSQSYWIWPRSRREVVPAGVHAIAVRLRLGRGPYATADVKTHSYMISSGARVSTVIREFDSLPTVQPGVAYSCPLFDAAGIKEPELDLEFKAGQAAGARVLAHAQVLPVQAGSGGASGTYECNPIYFWIGKRQQTALTSPTFVKRIGRLLGMRIS